MKSGEQISFDFCISGLRTLPSHTGPLKLQIQFIDMEGDRVLDDDDECLAEFGDDMYNPKVHYVKRVRKK